MTPTTSLVFFGTGPVSFATLEGIAGDFAIEAVITRPDSLHASGRRLAPPVKIWALDHRLPIFQPASKSDLQAVFLDHQFSSLVGLVVDFGLIIPATVIESFPFGIVNSHFSLLPEWRGADPITAAILSGQSETGVSLMVIDTGLDTGPLIAREPLTIAPAATTPSLTTALVELSNKLIQHDLPKYLNGSLKPFPQDKNNPGSYAPKREKAEGELDWHKSAAQLDREVRAFVGWPGSFTTLFDRRVIVTAAHLGEHTKLAPGTPVTTKSALAIAAGDGQLLVIDRLKPAGKAEMASSAFLAGLRHS